MIRHCCLHSRCWTLNQLEHPHHAYHLLEQQEAALLEEVAVQFSGVYEFVGPNNPSAKQFGELFDALVSFWAQGCGVL
eukprot:1159660-Pelagomonas_calceolata.AAC.6